MAVRKILRIGHPLLRQKSEEVPVTEIRSSEIKKLIRDMYDSMESADGIGLAAPQIGVLKRVVVVGFYRTDRYPELKDGIERRILINPEIEVLDSPEVGFWEGCLSVPDIFDEVERPLGRRSAQGDGRARRDRARRRVQRKGQRRGRQQKYVHDEVRARRGRLRGKCSSQSHRSTLIGPESLGSTKGGLLLKDEELRQ